MASKCTTGLAKSISAELPDYIIERNERAVAAGLQIARLSVTKKGLNTAFVGTAEQIIAAGFASDPDRVKAFAGKTTKSAEYGAVDIFSVDDRGCGLGGGSPWLHHAGNLLRITLNGERLPDSCRAGEVRIYTFKAPREMRSYVSDNVRSLADLGIAPDRLFDDIRKRVAEGYQSTWLPGIFSPTIWSLRAQCGRFVLSHFPENARKAEIEKRPGFANVEDYRGFLCRTFEFCEGQITGASDVKTKLGFRYVLDERTTQAVLDGFLEVQMALQRARIQVFKLDHRTEEERQVVRQSVVAAETDGQFQGFLRLIQGGKP